MKTRSGSHKSARLTLAAALGPWMAWACASSDRGPSALRQGGATASQEAPATDWGETVAGGGAAPAPSGPARSSEWAVVLATFAAEGHPHAAARSLQQLRSVVPQLADAWVHTTSKGSMVVYGHYEGPDSPQARQDLQMVKEITIENRPAFPSAMLTRVQVRSATDRFHPYELLSVRLRYPHLDPLYTLEVAIWGDFESGQLTLSDIHRHAEEHAARLRVQGYEAYFHHDDDKRLSTVTIGLFDRTAIDQRTGLYGPTVQALMSRFPAHLVNGERLLEPIDGRRPARGTRVQKPMLVQVPKL